MIMIIITILIYISMITFGSEMIYDLLLLFSTDPIFVSVMTNFLMYFIMVIPFILIFRNQLKTDFLDFKAQSITVGTILLNYLILLGAGMVGQIVLLIFGTDPEKQSLNQQAIENMMKSKYMLIVAITVIIGPFVEEIIYRKTVFDIFDKKLKCNPWIVAVLSGLLFGSIHVVLNTSLDNLEELIMAIPYAFQGFALSFMYIHYKKNIMVPIAVHTLSNFIAIVLLLYQPL